MEKVRTVCKLEPYVSHKIWGHEEWLLSTLHEKESTALINGERLPLSEVVGTHYPLLVKLLTANDTLSVQVHPDDEYAIKNENAHGKTECWYILDASPDAALITGIKGTFNRDTFYRAIQSGSLEEHLYKTPVQKGDFVFIPAGTVHAIYGGLRILEIQQPSDVTYRIYDWGRGRELHIEKSLDVIKSIASKPMHGFTGAFSCDYFTVEKIDIAGDYAFSTRGDTHATLFFVLNGSGTFLYDDESIPVTKDAAILLQSGARLTVSGTLSVLKIHP